MKFDTKKWKYYVEEHGADNLVSIIKNNPIYTNWVILSWIPPHHYLNYAFNPLINADDFALFTALDLGIEYFIINDPKTITRFEALEALESGKTLAIKDDVNVNYIMQDNELRAYYANRDTVSAIRSKSDPETYELLKKEFIIVKDINV